MTIRACPITTHYIGHIGYVVKMLGPLAAHSCKSMERTIGLFKKKNISPSLPGASFRKCKIGWEFLITHYLQIYFVPNYFLIEKSIQIQSALNNIDSFCELKANSIRNNRNHIDNDNDNDNDSDNDSDNDNDNDWYDSNDKDDVTFVGSPFSQPPDTLTISTLNAAITKYQERNEMIHVDGDDNTFVFFGRLKSGKHVHYSNHHLSRSFSRYTRSVSTCLVFFGGKW
jgi:hypothetical protein